MRYDLRLAVPAELGGQRLDRLLGALLPEVPRAALLDAFTAGRVHCDGRLARKGRTVRAGVEITIDRLAERSDWRARPWPGPVEIVAQNEEWIAASKPGGQACHPLHPDETGTLLNALLAIHPELNDVGEDPLAPALVHRIDGGTSGLVVAARSEASYRRLRAAFAAQQVSKRYLALVEGVIERPGGVAGCLVHTPGDRGVMRSVAPHAVPRGERALRAQTYYRPLRTLGGCTLLDVTLRTGVTHQIRCQLAQVGHPIVGDVRYGARPALGADDSVVPERKSIARERFFLHSLGIELPHPDAGPPCCLEASLASDLRRHLERLADDEHR